MDSNLKLSILIASTPCREEKLQKLLEVLEPQFDELLRQAIHSGIMPVELMIDKEDKHLSIGAKRQRMIEQADGEYIVFIDSDDLVHENYIELLLKNLGADSIGFLIDCYSDGKPNGRAKASYKYSNWGENMDGFKYVRSCYHKTPVKRELALKAGFGNERFGEDYAYSMRLNPLIKSEKFINEVMYIYQYDSTEPHDIKYGFVR